MVKEQSAVTTRSEILEMINPNLGFPFMDTPIAWVQILLNIFIGLTVKSKKRLHQNDATF
jgi:hypothetical protein